MSTKENTKPQGQAETKPEVQEQNNQVKSGSENTPEVKAKAKPVKKPEQRKPAEIEELRRGFDPKNREVIIERRGEKYRVRKPRTAFESPWITKTLALKVYNVKILCSQNQ